MADKKSLWNEAGLAGLVLGGISVAYLGLTALTGKVAAGNAGLSLLLGGLNIILWIAKFCACIFMMKFFLKKRSALHPEAGNNAIFRFGALVALLSALVYSACYLAYFEFIAPDMFDQALEVLKDNPMFGADSFDAMEQMMPKMPSYLFFINLFYCWGFGTILSAILSRNIPPVNPFADDDNTDEQ